MDAALVVDILAALAESQMTTEGLLRLLAKWGLQIAGAQEVRVAMQSGDLQVSARSRDELIMVGDLSTPSGVVPQQLRRWEIRHDETVHALFWLDQASATRCDEVTDAALQRLFETFGFFFHQRLLLDQATDQAVRDELTGCFNRRYLRQALERWIPQARAERFPVSLFLLDVDHFKLFNDRFGHAIGDQVLKMLGSLMRSIFRAQDVVCRYGGEEFAVLLCDHRSERMGDHPQEVFRYAERLRRGAEKLRLSGTSLPSDDVLVPPGSDSVLSHITISGGIATFPWDAGSAEELLQRADETLYRAKRDGRNRIYLADRVRVSRAA